MIKVKDNLAANDLLDQKKKKEIENQWNALSTMKNTYQETVQKMINTKRSKKSFQLQNKKDLNFHLYILYIFNGDVKNIELTIKKNLIEIGKKIIKNK